MIRIGIAITIDEQALAEIDRLVVEGVFLDRSKAIEVAVQERITRLHRSRLIQECAKLDRNEEQALAEGEYIGETGWMGV